MYTQIMRVVQQLSLIHIFRRGVCGTDPGTDGSLTTQPQHRLEPEGIGEGEDASDGEATAQEV